MDKKKEVDDIGPGTAPSRSMERFGFIKTEQSNSPEEILKSRSTHERGRLWSLRRQHQNWKLFVTYRVHFRLMFSFNRDMAQGMGFITGLLLLYMSEENSFWLIVALLKGAVHAPMEGLYQLFQLERLVREYMPKLGEHFVEEMINRSMYASQWFIAVFSYSFPFHITLRVWDVFLYEGIKVMFQVGLALLRFCHDDLVKLPLEGLLHSLRNFPDEAMDMDKLLPLAFSFKVLSHLKELEKEYRK